MLIYSMTNLINMNIQKGEDYQIIHPSSLLPNKSQKLRTRKPSIDRFQWIKDL